MKVRDFENRFEEQMIGEATYDPIIRHLAQMMILDPAGVDVVTESTVTDLIRKHYGISREAVDEALNKSLVEASEVYEW